MTPTEGQKKLRKLLGPRAAWRDTGKRTNPEDRAKSHAAWMELETKRKAAGDALNARKQQLLANDAEYQRQLAIYRESQEAQKYVGGRGYRITVGRDMGIAFEVRAEGDNWAEVIRALEAGEPGQMTVARVS